VKITVTENDIKSGQKKDGGQCAIAKAVRRIFGDNSKVYMAHGGRLTVRQFEFLLPRNIARWVEKFDAGRKVKPFSFWLTLGVAEPFAAPIVANSLPPLEASDIPIIEEAPLLAMVENKC
jgi:hypothetical protein